MNAGANGYVRIAKEEDRLIVAQILLKNGYTISPRRVKKDGKSYVYLLKYELLDPGIEGELQNEG